MTENERIWMAGIVDGRMRFRVKNDGTFELSLYDRDEELPRHVKKLAGCGGVYRRSKGWVWQTCNALHIRDFLAKVDPYLVLKQKQVWAVETAADSRHRSDKRRRENRIAQKRTAR